jgi:hypothetical protein
MRPVQELAHPREELVRGIVAAALGPEHLLQLALEVGVPPTRVAPTEMPLDLDPLEPDQLPVEVELDLSKDAFAVSR